MSIASFVSGEFYEEEEMNERGNFTKVFFATYDAKRNMYTIEKGLEEVLSEKSELQDVEKKYENGKLIIDGDMFETFTYRASKTGEPIVSLMKQRCVQAQILKRFIEDNKDDEIIPNHLEQLIEWRKELGEVTALTSRDGKDSDAHMFDVVMCELKDNKVTEEEAAEFHEKGRYGKKMNMDGLVKYIENETRIEAEEWMDATADPLYMISKIRALLRKGLGSLLGNAADLEGVRFIRMNTNEAERYNRLVSFVKNMEDNKTLEPFTFDEIPGYKTGTPFFGEMDGLAIVVFHDHGGRYAYAWNNNPEKDWNLKTAKEEDDDDDLYKTFGVQRP